MINISVDASKDPEIFYFSTSKISTSVAIKNFLLASKVSISNSKIAANIKYLKM
jgi:hypothetical protein